MRRRVSSCSIHSDNSEPDVDVVGRAYPNLTYFTEAALALDTAILCPHITFFI